MSLQCHKCQFVATLRNKIHHTQNDSHPAKVSQISAQTKKQQNTEELQINHFNEVIDNEKRSNKQN